jgi:hypothetical protein
MAVHEVQMRCPLCGGIDADSSYQALTKENFEQRAYFVECDRCGRFMCDEDLFEDIRDNQGKSRPILDESTALALSGAARLASDRAQQNREPGERLRLTYDNHNHIAAAAPVPLGAEYLDLMIETLATLCRFPGNPAPSQPARELAARLFLPVIAFNFLVGQLVKDGLVEVLSTNQERLKLILTPNGWRQARELSSPRNSDRVLVAMWFSPEMDAAYWQGIVPALTHCGYRQPFRVDDPEHDLAAGSPGYTNRIDNRIIAELRRSRFIVSDVTGARPGVYYEAGYADGRDIPIIWTCRAGAEKDMCFDTRQIAHILWKDPAHLQRELIAKIERHGWSLRK